MKIGGIKISKGIALALAPMAGYTTIAFRNIAASLGADLLYTELVSAAAIRRRNKSGKMGLLLKASSQGITGIQLFGSNAKDIGFASREISALIESGKTHAKFIDLNLGCPAKKVTKTGAGSALLCNMKTLGEYVHSAARNSNVPLTAKIRLGYSSKNVREIVKTLEKAGVDAIAVHARTATQKFSGRADWDAIARAVEFSSVPIIGNGDVKTAEDVIRMQEQAGCSGVMIGRAALSNPLIFAQAKKLLGINVDAKLNSKGEIFLQFLIEAKKEGLPLPAIKDFAMKLCTGTRGASELRRKITSCTSQECLRQLFSGSIETKL